MNLSSKLALSFFIIIGAILRIYQIGFQCLWLEEAFTLNVARLPVNEILATFDVNPPVYYLLAHFAGDIRYPALVAGILLIPAMYLLGREYKDELTGVFCSGITCILFPLVYYSQYGRAYTLSFLCFVIALIFYLRVSREPTSLNEHAFWIMIGVNAWVHLFSLIPLGLMGLILLTRKTRERWAYTLLPAVVCLPLVSMLLAVLMGRTIAAGDYGYGPLMMVLLTPGEFFGVLFVVVGALAAGWLVYGNGRELAGVAIATIGIGIFLSQFTPFFPRYYLTVSMIVILFAASFLSEIARVVPRKYLMAAVVGIILLFLALQYGDFITYYTVQKYVC